MVSEYIKASSVNWPCHLSSLSLLYFIFLTFLTLCGGGGCGGVAFSLNIPLMAKNENMNVFFFIFLLFFFFCLQHLWSSHNQPSEMTKKCLACICALPFSIPSMCCLREYSSTPGSIEKSKKRRDFFDFWSAALQLDGAACPLCPPTINHISEVLSLLRWPLYTTHIITISPHSKTFINIHWLVATCLWICNCKQL